MKTVYINGKCTAQRATGVQRVALNLIEALDDCLSQSTPSPSARKWVLLCPPEGAAPDLRHIRVRTIGYPGVPLHAWEQITLPLVARNGVLVSLAGSAPIFARRHMALLHDAAVFDCAWAYSAVFSWWYRTLFRQLARGGAKLLTVSAFSCKRLTAALGVDSDRIGVIPVGCDHLSHVVPDHSALARFGLKSTRFLLAVASDNPTKNVAALVSAFAQLPTDPQLRLVIVGGQNRRVFADSGTGPLAPNVVRTGPISDSALKVLYQHATALVFPSIYEGFGLPPFEAMMCGCPVAAARSAAIPEACGDAVLYFDPRSVESIVSALRCLLDDTVTRERLCKAGAERAASLRWGDSAHALLGHLAMGVSP